jgi:hypothetical protein
LLAKYDFIATVYSNFFRMAVSGNNSEAMVDLNHVAIDPRCRPSCSKIFTAHSITVSKCAVLIDLRYSASTASKTSSAWLSTFTLGQIFAKTPFPSIKNVARMMPM